MGFRGIQLRTAAVEAFGDRTAELKELLARHRLTFVALSSGNLGIEPAGSNEELARHVTHARFLRDCGGLKYSSRLLFLHVKDVRARAPEPGAAPGSPASRPYQFVELGQGRSDLTGVFRALTDVGFKGWLVVELDAVPDRARTPKACAEMNRDYITRGLGLTL